MAARRGRYVSARRARLEARGWRCGSTQEFLGLSVEDSALVELRLLLAKSLRVRRQKRKLSQTDLARMLRSSQSRVAKMESGDPSVSLDLLVRSLLALGASTRDLARAISGSAVAPASRDLRIRHALTSLGAPLGAPSITALCHPATYWMTGNTLHVDGGENVVG